MDIRILTDQELQLLNDSIASARHIVVCCHKSPDGDAIGSSLGWAEYLRLVGKNPSIIIPDAYPDFLQWLPRTNEVIRYDKHRDKAEHLMAGADLIFCLDFNATSRVGEMKAALDRSPASKIMFDHHLAPQMDTVLEVSRQQLSSTSELVFRIVWQEGVFDRLDKNFAVPVYCGMMTDTGGFVYNSSNCEIFFIVSQLMSKGFDKDKIYRYVYHNYSEQCIRFRGYLMYEKLHYHPQQKASYFTITRADMIRFRYVKGDAEGVVNEPLRIKGLRLSISMREDTEKDNLVWVSLRSVDHYHCNVIAEKFFNGGGHPNAAGGHLHCSIADAEEIAKNAIEYFGKLYGGGF